MRFCDLFISYKIGLKGIKNTIPFTKLPLYRKIFVIITYALIMVSAILLMFKLPKASLIILSTCILAFLIFIAIDSRKNNLETMLTQHYSPYSKERMDMLIIVLNQYRIDIHNSVLIDHLIEEAKNAQVQCDYLLPLKKPLKTLGAVVIPIIVYVARKIADAATLEQTMEIAASALVIVLLIFSFFFSIAPVVKNLLYRDYNKYNELIYDLRQIKIFPQETTDSPKSN